MNYICSYIDIIQAVSFHTIQVNESMFQLHLFPSIIGVPTFLLTKICQTPLWLFRTINTFLLNTKTNSSYLLHIQSVIQST